jgi:oligopeptide/dipeptide ABC transporter ATP-binding protein
VTALPSHSAGRTPLLSVRNLATHFPIRGGLFGHVTGMVRAVDGVSLDIFPGETLGVVGESGCGKTTLGRSILRLVEPTAGSIQFDGVDFRSLKGKALRSMRRHLQIIFQDPFSSLNPRLTIGATIKRRTPGPPPPRFGRRPPRAAAGRSRHAPEYASKYPHEFSGGQRQRIGIARALAVEPRLIVCDEPVSALDVSVQAQVINLLKDLQTSRGLAYLFIAHDLSVVEHMADRVAVMYLGRIMEQAAARDMYREPLMPYTQALLSAVPVPDPERKRVRIVLEGDPPSPASPPPGCVFHPRCHHPARDAACASLAPPLEEKAPLHWCACIKQPPTIVPWAEQERAGGVHPPVRHMRRSGARRRGVPHVLTHLRLPKSSFHGSLATAPSSARAGSPPL